MYYSPQKVVAFRFEKTPRRRVAGQKWEGSGPVQRVPAVALRATVPEQSVFGGDKALSRFGLLRLFFFPALITQDWSQPVQLLTFPLFVLIYLQFSADFYPRGHDFCYFNARGRIQENEMAIAECGISY